MHKGYQLNLDFFNLVMVVVKSGFACQNLKNQVGNRKKNQRKTLF